jgi:DNA modification methylase
MIKLADSLETLKTFTDYELDIIFTDPPYALGSEVIIKPNGKPDYKKAVDFMNKWEMPLGEYWEEFFKESYRTLKFGGRVLMYGIDRQTFMFKYYANLAGFQETQSLYWLFLSSFPKSTNLSALIDKHFNEVGEVVETVRGGYADTGVGNSGFLPGDDLNKNKMDYNITKPKHPLAKKYEGYRYSVAPLKQVVEEIMIFQKPYKTGSCLHDCLEYETGNQRCSCGAVDIDGNRVETNEELGRMQYSKKSTEDTINYVKYENQYFDPTNGKGRYPSQSFCSTAAATALDEQSGNLNSGSHHYSQANKDKNKSVFNSCNPNNWSLHHGGTGGCSKMLHRCDYDADEFDLYQYFPKVSQSERNKGLDGFDKRIGGGMVGTENQSLLTGSGNIRNNLLQNNHPTVKPISLNTKILKLFKTPNPQKIFIPFCGSGSEIIGAIRAGFTDWSACEINPEYLEIAQARIEHWSMKKVKVEGVVFDKKKSNLQENLFEL